MAREPRDAGRVAALRGATVDVDGRKVARVLGAAGLVAVVAIAVVLCVAGETRNAQLTELHTRGVAVAVTVTGCSGEIGGSGSNIVGYACTGRYGLDGRTFDVGIPGDADLSTGATVAGVAAAGDPGLFTTPSVLATERASASVLVLPGALIAAAALCCAAVAARRRRGRARYADGGV